MKKIILTGDRPTGKLHLGHFVGSLRERVRYQNSNSFDEIYIMIADSQALTDNFDNPEKIRKSIVEGTWLFSVNRSWKSNIFIQSQIPALCELTLLYELSYIK